MHSAASTVEINEAHVYPRMRSTCWIQDRADPRARQYAMMIAEEDPPPGASPEDALAEVREVLESIGDVCPECLPED